MQHTCQNCFCLFKCEVGYYHDDCHDKKCITELYINQDDQTCYFYYCSPWCRDFDLYSDVPFKEEYKKNKWIEYPQSK